ncbi:membrane protein [Actinorhabdospora filicis]|uniref:Membrane protein n=1 Tax=Actinorhabdospora filicis TaxID=1785913 RepID=A0A9W6W902_9ACTN|nr:GAP family protein [Actinorhabdospora filicis]GLZ78079.1 membrane protein [Actinorhabdospora filicis]
MGETIGELLPLAIGVAISPVPIIAVILMLFAPRATGTSLGFLLGWIAGIIAATALFVWLAGITDLGSGTGPSAAVSWIKLALGALLLLLALRRWRARPAPGTEAALPTWMAAIDEFTPAKALGLGFALSAINPKNLAMCAAAGVTIGGAALPGGQQVTTAAIFTILAACTVAVPVIAYALASSAMRAPLDRLKAWLQGNNATVMATLLLVLGVVLVGKGLGGLL